MTLLCDPLSYICLQVIVDYEQAGVNVYIAGCKCMLRILLLFSSIIVQLTRSAILALYYDALSVLNVMDVAK